MNELPAWFPQIAQFAVIFVVAVGLVQTLIYLSQLIFAGYALHSRYAPLAPKVLWDRYADHAPAMALIAPAYNEALTIIESVEALLSLQYPDFEVIVVNDGSKDRTLDVLIENYNLQQAHRYHDLPVPCEMIRGIYASPKQPRLLVVDKKNGGKADAINAGINIARAPLMCVIDADTLLRSDALLRVARPFIDDPAQTVAVGGTIRIANGSRVEAGRVTKVQLPRRFLPLVQIVEYSRAFMTRLGQCEMQTLMIISGAFGAFRRSAVIEVGGFSRGTVGEDFEVVVKLHRHFREQGRPYRIKYIPDAVAWTEAPETLKILGNQRSRWQRGALETYNKHHDMFLNPRFGRIGFLGFGQVWVIDFLGPVVELIGLLLVPPLWLLEAISPGYALAFISVTVLSGVFITIVTLVLEEVQAKHVPRIHDFLILGLVAVVEGLGYRQLNNFWRLRGWWQYLRKNEQWGDMVRKGFQKA